MYERVEAVEPPHFTKPLTSTEKGETLKNCMVFSHFIGAEPVGMGTGRTFESGFFYVRNLPYYEFPGTPIR